MITSTSNPLIKQIRKLKDRKFRKKSGLFYMEGLRIVGEAVQTGAHLEQILYCPELLTSDFGYQLIESQKVTELPVVEISENVFRSFSLKSNPQGIAAIGRQKWQQLDAFDIGNSRTLWLALDSIQDPGNLGTILRTGDSVGAEGVLLLDQSTDPYAPTAIRSSMGSVFSQKLVLLSLEELDKLKKKSDIPIIGAAGESPVEYFKVHYPESMILLMGSEREGLTERHLELCDYCVSIPMIGRSDSLNLSVATAIILYKIFEQRIKSDYIELKR